MGLPIFEVLESDEINEGDLVKIDLDNGTIHNFDTNKTYNFSPIPEFMQELIAAGGLINYAREEINNGK
jgi:3-isopropylmalate/(R)-2-methylmalate dehydratase small subunit